MQSTSTSSAPRSAHARWARRGIYTLLALVMALGLGLSVLTSRMVNETRATASRLLGQDAPKLELLTAFESALLLHQAALDNDFAYPAEHERFHQVATETLDALQTQYPLVAREIGDAADLAALQSEFTRFEQMDRRLRGSLDAHREDAATRALIARFNASTGRIRLLVARNRARLQQAVTASGRATIEGSGRIATLIYAYIGFAVASALCLLYHVRARVKSEDRLAYVALHDELTRLPNRWAFLRRIARLGKARVAQGAPDAAYTQLLIVEADRFDRMAAGLGPAGADRLVQHMAERAQAVAQLAGAQAYRLGESKFALLQTGATDPTGKRFADALQARFGEPVVLGAQEIVLSASIGSSTLAHGDRDGSALIQKAETALHLARRRGGAHIAYCRELDHALRDHLAIEARLRHAIDRGELALHYQPQQRLLDRDLTGFEALLRWQSEAGMVSPADFIPLAEESGLILPIGDWVLAEAFRQAAAWNADGAAPLTVAVNISPRQFEQPRFLDQLRQHLARSGARPQHIELEITEGILMEGANRSAELLAELRALGFRLSIDDFGTGYSSLSYLKRFPVHKLKIDQAFVRQLEAVGDDAEIIKAIISLGHSLGFSVIAEGVETPEQASLLVWWGCDQIQGYHYGRPMPADAAAAFIAQARAGAQTAPDPRARAARAPSRHAFLLAANDGAMA